MLKNERLLRELYIEVSNKCYLTCKHCSSEASAANDEFIDIHTLCRIVKEGKELGTKSLTISGGEPLLHPSIFQFGEFATRNGFTIKMYSCGVIKEAGKLSSISDEIFIKIKNSGIKTLIFSLHGKPSTHDYITNILGSYNLTIESIKKALKYGLDVEIHTVPMTVNLLEIPFILKIAERFGIEQVSLLRLVPQGRFNPECNLLLSPEEHCTLSQIVRDYPNEKCKVRVGSPYSCFFTDRLNRCSAGKNKLLIGANGDVYPCEAFKTKLKNKTSNINKSSLKEIWDSDDVINTIRYLSVDNISSCSTCINSKSCLGGCHGQRLLAHGQLDRGPDPICIINSGR